MAYLTKKRQDEIDEAIKDLSFRYADEDYYYPPVDVQAIAEKRGIEVIQSNISDFPGSPSGFITYKEPEKKIGAKIFIESSMGLERRRFTLAHELGHCLLHKGEKFRMDAVDYSQENTLEESEANYFAASLLVPADFLIKLLEMGKTNKELSDFFQVSLPAIRNRIHWVSAN